MELQTMAREYIDNSAIYTRRIKELQARLDAGGLTATERINLRKRIIALDGISREARSTGRYLANYYAN